MVLSLLLAECVCACADTHLRKKANSTRFSINDKILVDGNTFAEGAAIGDNLGCQEFPKGTSSFSVCGCAAKVIAHLLTECQEYKQYDTTIGTCDCGQGSACHEVELESGYTDKFNWNAYSFEVASC